MSLFLSIILGTYVIFPVFGLSLVIPEPGSDDERCLNASTAEHFRFFKCVEETINVGADIDLAEIHNGSICPRCQHICSQKDNMLECRKQFSDALEPLNISNKATEMIDFSAEVFETGASFLCHNSAEMLGIYLDDDKREFLEEALRECNPFILLYMSPYLYCDFGSSDDEDRRENTCRTIYRTASCVEEDVKKDKPELENFMTGVLNVIRNSEVCAKHLQGP